MPTEKQIEAAVKAAHNEMIDDVGCFAPNGALNADACARSLCYCGKKARAVAIAALEAAEAVAWCSDMSKAPDGPHLRGVWVNHWPSGEYYWDVAAGFVDDDVSFKTGSGDYLGCEADDYEMWAAQPPEPPR